MTSFRISDRTRQAQALASDPALSVFVSANAGSGKTHVLTERVVRLLLSGADASRILCLTYTKAAAAEMATRVFGRLSAWATAPEPELAAELARIEGKEPSAERLRRARRLFALALETPGGLKIQTIHAFCEAILHQFPLEANVPGHFEVLDDAESAMLLAEARRLLITGAAGGRNDAEEKQLGEAFASALSLAGEWGLDQLLGEIVRKRDAIRRHIAEAGGLNAAVDLLRSGLGLAEGEDEAAILGPLWPCPHLDPATCAELVEAAAASPSASDDKLRERMTAFIQGGETAALRFETYQAMVLDSKGNVRASLRGFATKAVAECVPHLEDKVRAAGERARAIAERIASLRLFRASRAALVIADRLEADYAALKRRRGRLDFEDLIVHTADLLSRSEASSWVHYKLDQGIDHVLIDEAQDTSPRQWQVMRSLVEEFFVGESARGGIVRTVFAVGDEKQSIYSFQGASPRMFADERRDMRRRAAEAARRFEEVELHQSFRTVREVLGAVDRIFADPDNRRGLSVGGEAPSHETARDGEPGLVEIWPVVQAARTDEPGDWLQAIDHQPENAPANRLARRIAERIQAWIGDPILHKGELRPLDAGDFLVLVRKRSSFVDAMAKAIRDLKDARIRVAGADRLVITDHIAVQDLMALGRTVANAEDDLSLAEVLKSPLFGFSDDQLMALALSRRPRETLYLGLRRLAGPEGGKRVPDFVSTADRPRLLQTAAAAFERIERLRFRSGFESVFSFYARILGPEGGRARLTARLGSDAGEVLDAFLDLALAEEEAGQRSLDAFLANLAATPPEIKREMEHGRGEVRIMTTHAAKGLEAPVIFLVDPGSAPFSHIHGARLIEWEEMPGIYPGQAPGFLWRAAKGLENGVVERLKQTEKERAEDEYRRLLYVGLTRAADRLVVCGTAGVRGPDEACWLRRVEATLKADCEEVKDEAGNVLAWRFGSDGRPGKLDAVARAPLTPRRRLDLSPLPPEVLPPRALNPSSAGGALRIELGDAAIPEAAPGYVSPVLGGGSRPSFAIRRGLLVHRLLQVLPDLPPGARDAAARRYLDASAGDIPASERNALVASVFAVLDDAAFAPIFAPASRAEVALAGRLELGGRSYSVSGAIDRLAVTPDAVMIVDYKTDRSVPETVEAAPPAYLLQLALYREMLGPLYPGRQVRAALLFTERPALMPVDAMLLDEALAARARVAERTTHRQAEESVA